MDLVKRFKNLPADIDRICWKGLKSKTLKERRREFLGELAKREHCIMIEFYRSQKKKLSAKKMANKLLAMKEANLESILDNYFYSVCCKFYRRQSAIWCGLKFKYFGRAYPKTYQVDNPSDKNE